MFRVQSIVLIKRQSKSSMVLWSLFSNMFFSDMPIVEEVHTYKRVRRRIYVLGFFFFYIFLTYFYIILFCNMGFPVGSDSKESACNLGNLGLILRLERSPWWGQGNPLQHSCLENPSGQRSLVDYSPRGHKESDTTEWLSTFCNIVCIFALLNNCFWNTNKSQTDQCNSIFSFPSGWVNHRQVSS